MASIDISNSAIPDLTGQVAIVTGGSSGIGLATVELLCQKGCRVWILDVQKPDPKIVPELARFRRCDLTVWSDLSTAFQSTGHVDMVFANAGVVEDRPFLDDLEVDSSGVLVEPRCPLIDLNLKATINTIKLAVHSMKKQDNGGRIVLTSSSAAYMPELILPLYSAMKLALIGLVRSLRNLLPAHNITINAVAPAATLTPIISKDSVKAIKAAGLALCDPQTVASGLIFSATANEDNPIEIYGEGEEDLKNTSRPTRWNGRVIIVSGENFYEVEEQLMATQPQWLDQNLIKAIRDQQRLTMSLFRGTDG